MKCVLFLSHPFVLTLGITDDENITRERTRERNGGEGSSSHRTFGHSLQLDLVDASLVHNLDRPVGEVDEEARLELKEALAKEALGLLQGEVLLVVAVKGSQGEGGTISVGPKGNLVHGPKVVNPVELRPRLVIISGNQHVHHVRVLLPPKKEVCEIQQVKRTKEVCTLLLSDEASSPRM